MGAWKGSNVKEMQIALLRRSRKIPADLDFRLPGDEIVPAPRAGERVVFLAHFQRGFGLPVSQFFRDFLDFYRMQPHHLGANAIMLLSTFVALCEGYLIVRPTIGLWCRLFYFRSFRVGTSVFVINPKTVKKEEVKVMTECGGATIYIRKVGLYPHPQLPQSIKNWQMGFFYVSSPKDQDLLNLPEFSLPPPTSKYHWAEKPGDGDTDLDHQVAYIQKLMDKGLQPADLVATWLCRRVLPLQRRCHRICDMHQLLDSTRISTFRINEAEFLRQINSITDLTVVGPFEFRVTP